MFTLSFSGQMVLTTPRAAPAILANLERLLRLRGADSARTGAGLTFAMLPLRHLFPSLMVQAGTVEFEVTSGSANVRYAGYAPLLPVLGPILLVLLVMGGMAVHSGAPAINIAGVSVVALALVAFGVRSLCGLALRRLVTEAVQT